MDVLETVLRWIATTPPYQLALGFVAAYPVVTGVMWTLTSLIFYTRNEREPLPADSELWDVPRLLLTPHVSAVSPRGYWRRELELFTDNWARFASGRPMRNVVDKRAGY